MDDDQTALTRRLGHELRAARLALGLSTAALAEAAGVSRGSVLKLERAGSQPSAALLGRLCVPLGLTLSGLFARVEGPRPGGDRVLRHDAVPTWTDPATGYRRRSLSPRPAGPVQLTEIVLPASATVTYPAQAYALIHQQVWVLDGTLELVEGAERHRLETGDCLELGPPADCTFRNPGDVPARYVVVTALR